MNPHHNGLLSHVSLSTHSLFSHYLVLLCGHRTCCGHLNTLGLVTHFNALASLAFPSGMEFPTCGRHPWQDCHRKHGNSAKLTRPFTGKDATSQGMTRLQPVTSHAHARLTELRDCPMAFTVSSADHGCRFRIVGNLMGDRIEMQRSPYSSRNVR